MARHRDSCVALRRSLGETALIRERVREVRTNRSRQGVAAAPEKEAVQRWINAMQLCRFPLACAVLAVHASGMVISQTGIGTAGKEGAGFGIWLLEFVTMLCRLATPSFLFIAGYVFFRDGVISQKEYGRKLKSRVGTLVVPYLVWNLVAVLIMCGPSAANYLLNGSVSTGTFVTPANLKKWFLGWPIFPADAPLWFVRDLLILLLVAPIFHALPKMLQLVGIAALVGYWLWGPADAITGGIPRASSAIFVFAGAWMGANRVAIRATSATRKIALISGAIFLSACALGASAALGGADYLSVREWLDKVVRLSGMVVVICGAVHLSLSSFTVRRLHDLSRASFFLYASHFCVLLVISSLLKQAVPGPRVPGQAPALFLIVFLTGLAGCLGMHWALKRYAPSILSLLDGNRSGAVEQRRTHERGEFALVPGEGRLSTVEPWGIKTVGL